MLKNLVPLFPSGERVRWDEHGELADVKPKVLRIAAGRLAAVSLLARRWKKGKRNQLALALSGTLLRANWDQEDVTEFVITVAIAANDEEVEKRVAAVTETRKKLDAKKPVTNLPKLIDLVGEKPVHSFCEWLGIRQKNAREMRVAGSASQATQLIALTKKAKLFHTTEQEAFAVIEMDSHRETWHLKSPQFKRWLAARFYKSTKMAPLTQAINVALGVLEGKALYESRAGR